ncbi:hypothetical protein Lal_00021904 [Lupinus albus]|nr:hypothetical protein Lal_00021904 [Lupinus albus]
MNKPPLDLSFYPEHDQPRITSLVTQYNIIYIIELVKYYDNNSQAQVEKEVENLVQDVSYEEFLNRVHAEEVILREKGLWDVPHPWLNMFIPSSRISDFNEGVFKGIILKQNISSGIYILYPMNRNKWDDRMSAVIAVTTSLLIST